MVRGWCHRLRLPGRPHERLPAVRHPAGNGVPQRVNVGTSVEKQQSADRALSRLLGLPLLGEPVAAPLTGDVRVLLTDLWQQRWPGCPPVGYKPREPYRNFWVRFHSLPESKRYPENESDYSVVLGRHNGVFRRICDP
ncbi:DUF3885 domain-containing protein [Streptomyces typhae]|uniref:DUF3885 domain-containing protein n=1 Tax=Streptomyces typhae TaxID=2681492 RepID=UPI003CCD6842